MMGEVGSEIYLTTAQGRVHHAIHDSRSAGPKQAWPRTVKFTFPGRCENWADAAEAWGGVPVRSWPKSGRSALELKLSQGGSRRFEVSDQAR